MLYKNDSCNGLKRIDLYVLLFFFWLISFVIYIFYFFLLKMHPNFSIVKHLLHDTHLAR